MSDPLNKGRCSQMASPQDMPLDVSNPIMVDAAEKADSDVSYQIMKQMQLLEKCNFLTKKCWKNVVFPDYPCFQDRCSGVGVRLMRKE